MIGSWEVGLMMNGPVGMANVMGTVPDAGGLLLASSMTTRRSAGADLLSGYVVRGVGDLERLRCGGGGLRRKRRGTFVGVGNRRGDDLGRRKLGGDGGQAGREALGAGRRRES